MYNRVNPKTSKTVSLDLKLLVTIFRLQYTSLASMARHFQMKDSEPVKVNWKIAVLGFKLGNLGNQISFLG